MKRFLNEADVEEFFATRSEPDDKGAVLYNIDGTKLSRAAALDALAKKKPHWLKKNEPVEAPTGKPPVEAPKEKKTYTQLLKSQDEMFRMMKEDPKEFARLKTEHFEALSA